MSELCELFSGLMAWSCGLLNGASLAMFDIKITFRVVLLIVVDSSSSLPLNWTCQSTPMLCIVVVL